MYSLWVPWVQIPPSPPVYEAGNPDWGCSFFAHETRGTVSAAAVPHRHKRLPYHLASLPQDADTDARIFSRGYGESCAIIRDVMEEQAKPKRVVVIVGRPNVGKSALFNRIANRRIAIVHDQSGVTRDRIVREVAWHDESFRLVDTGGIRLFDGTREADTIEMAVREQVDVAMADAAAVILVVDVLAGIQPADEEVARLVHKSGRPCFLAINKCDLPRHEKGTGDFDRLPFPSFAVSAQHNRGVDDLMAEVVKTLPPKTEQELADEQKPLRVAIVGRPNAGKSSYINRLLRSDRVIVSNVAGTTRDCVDVPFTIGTGATARNYTLVDTAGMRHVHKIDTSVERFSLFRSEEAVRECDVAVLVMDAEIGPTTQDKFIASMIQREAKACVMLINKWDLARAKGYTETAAIDHLREMLPFLRHVPVVFMSAQDGYNVRNSIEAIDRVAGNQKRILPTGILNRTMANALSKTQMPSKNGRQLRFHYVTQTGANPMILRLFVNDARLVVKSFQDYIIRNIREAFDLEGAALILQFRSRVKVGESDKRPGADGEADTPDGEAATEAPPRRRRPAPRPARGGKSGRGTRGGERPSLGRGKSNLTPKSRRPKR